MYNYHGLLQLLKQNNLIILTEHKWYITTRKRKTNTG